MQERLVVEEHCLPTRTPQTANKNTTKMCSISEDKPSSLPLSSTSSSQHEHSSNNNPEENNKNKKGFKYYDALYKAARQGDWSKAERFFQSDPAAAVARISSFSWTALHVSAMSGHIVFVEEMVKLMPKDALALKDALGYTALHSAVAAGNTELAKVMVEKNPDLTQMRTYRGETPIIRAARLGQKDLLLYLCSETRDEDPNSPFKGVDGVDLLETIVVANRYDVAIHLVKRYPYLATTVEDCWSRSVLLVLAEKSSAFKSGSGLGFFRNCIYSCIQVVKLSKANGHTRGDMENPPVSSRDCTNKTQVAQVLRRFWDALLQLVPCVKQIYDIKVMHTQAQELLECICRQIALLNTPGMEINRILRQSTILAVENGNVEVLNALIEIDPDLCFIHEPRLHQNILHIAIKHRQEEVFNYIRKMGPITTVLAAGLDDSGNTILHQAARLGPLYELNKVSVAVLQVQRELQWYKVVEKLVQPAYRGLANCNGEKPRVLFTKEHRDIFEKGDKWMKEMVSSSMVVSTLIATVTFAAVFTIPGGNNNDGTPNILSVNWFMVFVISDAIALFSSLTSMLMFLSIFTSGYAEEDFLDFLPRKLITGLEVLCFSIVAMMVTFIATYFIMLGRKLAWLACILALLAFCPLIFAFSQFSLFIEAIRLLLNGKYVF